MSHHEPSHAAAGIPLKAHVEELRSRCEAVSRLQGGSTYYHEELGIFRGYAEESGLYLVGPPPELSRPPDDEGNEHQVWYLSGTETVLKATWPLIIDGNTAFFDPERNIVISDTHRGNIILMEDGLLAPIDLRVQRLSSTLLDIVSRLAS
jgi:hypothetical protein